NVPPAPGRFSTTTDCASTLDNLLPTSRATMSPVPPGAKFTIRWIGLEGNPSGRAGAAAKPIATATAAAAQVLFNFLRKGLGAGLGTAFITAILSSGRGQ